MLERTELAESGVEEVKGNLKAACSYGMISCKGQQIQAFVRGGMLFNEGQEALTGSFRLNVRKIVFIRDVVKHRSTSSTEAGEFLLKDFEIQRKLWLM